MLRPLHVIIDQFGTFLTMEFASSFALILGRIKIFSFHIHMCVCEYPYAYIGSIQWEVKQMKARGD